MTSPALDARRYAFAADLRVLVRGGPQVTRHFDAEYGRAATGAGPAEVVTEIRFGFDGVVPSGSPRRVVRGGHKSVRWVVALSEPDSRPLESAINLRGRPRALGLSLIQGYFLEPLVSLGAARAGQVLVPSAAFAEDHDATLLMGPSGSGKSTLSVRALAAGRTVLGDDQVLLDAAARCSPFPRRMRFYSDLAHTAPSAYTCLGRRTRAALRARGVVKSLTRGFVAPSLPVDASALGQAGLPPALPLRRAVVIERVGGIPGVTVAPCPVEEAVAHAVDLLDQQRAHLRAATDRRWIAAIEAVRATETATLWSAFERVPVERYAVPREWGAPRAIGALAARLRVEGVQPL